MLVYYTHVMAISLAKWFPAILTAAAGEHGGEEGAQDHGGEGGHGGGIPHLQNIIGILFPHISDYLWISENTIFAFGAAIMLSVLAIAVYSKREMIPKPFQNGVEYAVEGMYNFLQSILGKHARRYTPFLGTLFFYILINNWLGMIPFGHSPSTGLNITASLAILVFFYAQAVGIRRLGILGYLDHLAGSPRDVVSWVLVPLMFVLHLVGEFVKPVSLALRLRGNIFGEDTLIAVFVIMGASILSFLPVGIPLQLPFYFLGLLLSTIQALVFTLLSSIYILLMLPHEEHH